MTVATRPRHGTRAPTPTRPRGALPMRGVRRRTATTSAYAAPPAFPGPRSARPVDGCTPLRGQHRRHLARRLMLMPPVPGRVFEAQSARRKPSAESPPVEPEPVGGKSRARAAARAPQSATDAARARAIRAGSPGTLAVARIVAIHAEPAADVPGLLERSVVELLEVARGLRARRKRDHRGSGRANGEAGADRRQHRRGRPAR